MRIAVRYQSRGGSTRKVAEAIARKAGVAAKPLDPDEKLADIDLLFVGGGVYAGKPHKMLTDALSALSADQAGCLAFFSTSMDPEAKMEKKLRAAVKDPAIAVMGDAFNCLGKFLFFKRDRPDSNDLSKAESFAKRTIEARRKALEALR